MTIGAFMDSWAPELRNDVRIIHYRRLLFPAPLPDGPVIFADLEKLRFWELAFGKRLHRAAAGRAPRLNNPCDYIGKFELLKRLHRSGLNTFRAFRIQELDSALDLKFPVFLKRDSDHKGAVGGLIQSRAELDQALKNLSLADRWQSDHLMVIEYCDCADQAGVFRKYSAMKIGGRLIPSHIYFSQKWVTKTPEMVNEIQAAEEAAFVDAFPHRDQIAEVFRLAQLDYGRVDYGVKGGKVQTWEINTNPIIVRRREIIHPLRLASQSKSAAMIAQAFQNLARGTKDTAAVPEKQVAVKTA